MSWNFEIVAYIPIGFQMYMGKIQKPLHSNVELLFESNVNKSEFRFV